MIGHTEAFVRYKEKAQRYLDFVVLVATAVPNLESALQDETIPLVPPDHFKDTGRNRAALRRLVTIYQQELASTSVVTLFSFFEEYVRSAIQEIVEFHGGDEVFLESSKTRSSRSLGALPSSVQQHKRKLQEHPKKAKAAKYRKHSAALTRAGYAFPTDLLATYGARALLDKLHPKRGLKAWEIPDVVEEALLLGLSPKRRSRINEIRTLRNRIAHGTVQAVTLKRAMSMGRDLREIVILIDKHIVEHFMVIQEFA